MAGPKAVIIGRVAVKVVPDTDDFPEQLRRQLKSKNLPTAKVDVDPDMTGFLQELNEEVEEAEKKARKITIRIDKESFEEVTSAITQIDNLIEDLNRTTLDPFDPKSLTDLQKIREELEGLKEDATIRIKYDENDLKSMEKALDKIDAQIRDLSAVPVDLDVFVDEESLSEVRADIENAIKEAGLLEIQVDNDAFAKIVDRVNTLFNDIRIRPELDFAATEKARAELIRLMGEKVKIETELDEASTERAKFELRQRLRGVQAKIDVVVDQLDAAVAEAELAALARDREAKIAVRIDRRGLDALQAIGGGLFSASGIGFVRNEFAKFTKVLLNLGETVPALARTSLALGGIGLAGLAAAQALFSLSSSLAEIGPLLFAAPGLFAGVAVGLGITTAALVDFNKRLPEVGRKFKRLQNIISDNFFAKFTKPFREFFRAVFPTFRREIAKTATTLGKFFGDFATSLRKAFKPEVIEELFGNLRKSINIFGQSTDAVARIIANLGIVGARYLPELARYVGDLAERFDAFLQKEIDSGNIFASIDRAIETVQDLGRIVLEVVEIFGTLGRAAETAGGPTIDSLANSLANLSDQLRTDDFLVPFVQALTGVRQSIDTFFETTEGSFGQFFTALASLISRVGPTIGRTLGEIFNTISDVFSDPRVQDGIVEFFNDLEGAVKKAQPGLENIGAVLGPLAGLFGEVADNIGILVGNFGDAASSGGLGRFLEAITDITDRIGDFLEDILPKLQPLMQKLSENMADAAEAAAPLVDAMLDLAELVAPVVIPALTLLAGIIGESIELVFGGLTRIFRGLFDLYTGVADIVTGLLDVLAGLARFDFGRVVDGLISIVSGVGGILTGLFQIVVGIVQTILGATIGGIVRRGLTKIVSLFGSILGKVPGAVSGIFRAVGGAISRAFSSIVSGARTALSRFGSLISTGFNRVVGFAQNLGGRVANLISTMWGRVRQLSGAAIAAVIGAVAGWVNNIVGFVRDLGSRVGNAVSNLWGNVKSIFSRGVAKVISTMARLVTGVTSKISGLATKIRVAASSVITAAVGIGRSIMEGIARGIGAAIGVVTGAISSAASTVASAARNAFKINSPSKVMIPIGESVSEGIAVGIKRGAKRFLPPAMKAVAEIVVSLDQVVAAFRGRIDAFEAALQRLALSGFGRLESVVASSLRAIDKATRETDLRDFVGDLESQLESLSKEFKKSDLGKSLAGAVRGKTIPALQALGNQFERLQGLISEQAQALQSLVEEARNFAETVKDGLLEFADVTNNTPATFEEVRDNLRASVQQATRFAGVLADLQRLGLNRGLLQQIIDAGAGEGLTVGLAILEGGASGIAELNALRGQLEGVANNTGDLLAKELFEAQIDSAKGLLEGLLNERDELVATMESIYTEAAQVIDAALKKAGDNLIKQLIAGLAGIKIGAPGGGGPAGPTGPGGGPSGQALTDRINKASDLVINAIEGGIKNADKREDLARILDRFSLLTDKQIEKFVTTGNIGQKGLERAVDAINNLAAGDKVGAQVNRRTTDAVTSARTVNSTQTIIYNAAPNNSISSENDLFRALTKARMAGQ